MQAIGRYIFKLISETLQNRFLIVVILVVIGIYYGYLSIADVKIWVNELIEKIK